MSVADQLWTLQQRFRASLAWELLFLHWPHASVFFSYSPSDWSVEMRLWATNKNRLKHFIPYFIILFLCYLYGLISKYQPGRSQSLGSYTQVFTVSGLGYRLWLVNRCIIYPIITTYVCLILETAKALKRIRFFAKAVTFTDSESEGYTAPSLNDLYGHIIDPNSHPCNKLEKTESKEPTPSQFLIGVCFNKCTEPTNHKEKSPKTPVKKETRAKRNVAVRKKGK